RGDLDVRLERRRDHPEDGEDEDDEDGEADDVPGDPPQPAPTLAPDYRGAAFAAKCGDLVRNVRRRGHWASPSFTIRRTYTTLSAATMSSIRSEIAAPRPKSE